ncbi:MAG TPA: ribulose-phosphate 3-epimerase [Caldithrix abyssi]|uniref:Ribulose-phosphate 3-epimerase n=1 Tax=Caldithrix abyssi TaxID=187145 RepID=A0A7V4U105_CALAY|nr:ribulose-phosphate 3-epimerase [Caldithrix abyssi]
MKKIYLAPSILSCDLLKLEEQVRLVAENGADFIHVDIMDGHFVPNLTFGPNMVKALRRITDIPLDVHLMIERPDDYLQAYIEAGAYILTVHQEACTHLHRTVQRIHQLGAKAGVSLNPATSLRTVEEILPDLDLLLIMTVNPGFGGQAFIPGGVDKVKRARKMIEAVGKEDFLLEVDGGINEETAGPISAAGANVLVAGNAIFNQPDIVQAMHNIHAAARSYQTVQA